ncbi:MAG: nucleoside triphosphate pyrophosphohydrolase [Oscillospiraceae bacterium]
MEFTFKEKYNMEDLLQIVAMLRDKDNGCPWDKVQTHKSIRKNFIEETYEVAEAIDDDNKPLMQEELGDVLLQILLHSQFEAEEGVFSFFEVVDGIAKKLILRHPHVFTGFDNKTVEGVLAKWEEIKKEEKGQETASETISAIPKSFPALMYTQKLQKRAVAGGLDRQSKGEILDKLQGQLDILRSEVEQGKECGDSIAELLYNTVSLSYLAKIDAEELLEEKNKEKVSYFRELDNLLLQNSSKFDTINNVLFLEYQEQALKNVK